MGATSFTTTMTGNTMRDAFLAAREHARYMHGAGGYTGSIAEKRDVREVQLPEGVDIFDFIDWCEGVRDVPPARAALVRHYVDTYNDKWGAALGVRKDATTFVFFGLASC